MISCATCTVCIKAIAFRQSGSGLLQAPNTTPAAEPASKQKWIRGLCPHTLLAVPSKTWAQLKSKDVRRNLGMVSIWRLMEAMLKGSSPLPVITSGLKCHSSAGAHAITRAVQIEQSSSSSWSCQCSSCNHDLLFWRHLNCSLKKGEPDEY